MSLTVSLYSGANVAQVSTPHDDQAMIQSQTSDKRTISHVETDVASSPVPAVPSSAPQVRFALSKSPFRNGRIMNTKSGIISSAPAR